MHRSGYKVRITGWMLKYDDELQTWYRWMALKNPSSLSIKAPLPPLYLASKSSILRIRQQRLVEGASCIVSDNRQKGGVLSVLLNTPDDTIEESCFDLASPCD
jgi:hypothetical protein